MKKAKAALVTGGFLGLCVIVLAGTWKFGGYLIRSPKSGPQVQAVSQAKCDQTKKAFNVVIENDVMYPNKVNASLCDTMTVTNRDNKGRLIAFGVHDHHQAYDGVEEKLLHKDQSFTITLNETGTYVFHDHFQDEVEGEVIIQ